MGDGDGDGYTLLLGSVVRSDLATGWICILEDHLGRLVRLDYRKMSGEEIFFLINET